MPSNDALDKLDLDLAYLTDVRNLSTLDTVFPG